MVQKTEIAVRDIATTKELLQQYINIDNEVRALESKNMSRQYDQLMAENKGVKEDIARLEQAYNEAKKKT